MGEGGGGVSGQPQVSDQTTRGSLGSFRDRGVTDRAFDIKRLLSVSVSPNRMRNEMKAEENRTTGCDGKRLGASTETHGRDQLDGDAVVERVDKPVLVRLSTLSRVAVL